MGMLDRYRKPGGFVQLVSLIESLGSAKQEKFLSMIQEEDPIWMEAVKQKMLTIERIFSWSNDTVSDIVRRLPTKSLASALKGLKEEHRTKAFCLMSNSEKRKVEDEMSGLSDNPAEAQANVQKLIEMTRKMIQETDLRLDNFAPDLMIEEGIEAKLAEGKMGSKATAPKTAEPAQPVTPISTVKVIDDQPSSTSNASAADVASLQNMVLLLTRENKQLKADMKLLKDKLEQIKRIA